MPSPLIRGAHAIVLLGLLVGCGSAASSVEPTTPERPAVPDGWHEVASDAGDVRLALPADLDVIFTGAGIMAQRPVPDEARLEVLASGPADVVPQPRSGEHVRTWLEQSERLPVAGEGGVTQTADRAEREVVLPAGPGGLAIIRFVGAPARMDAEANELRLIALLAQFGDLADPS